MNAPTPGPRPELSKTANNVTLTVPQIVDLLLAITAGWPKVVNGELCVRLGTALLPIQNEAALFAWIGTVADVHWSRTGPTKKEFFEALKMLAPRADWATPHPHYPPLDGVLYLDAPPAPSPTGRLDELVARFAPATPADRDLIKLLFVTPAAHLPPGKRPAFAVTAATGGRTPDPRRGRGAGKTTLVDTVGQLYGGAFPLRLTDSHDRAVSDLLSPAARTLRVVKLDNVKTYKLSSDLLEGMVTAPEIGGHVLYAGYGSRPNHLTFCITMNGLSLSKDMAERSVVIRLGRPAYSATWWRDTDRLIADHRADIFADIGHFLAGKPRELKATTRWDVWDHEVLARLPDPNPAVDLILARQREVDEDDGAAEDVVAYIGSQIRRHAGGHAVDRAKFWLPSPLAGKWMAEWNGRMSPHQGVAALANLECPRLYPKRRNTGRGFVWVGAKVAADAEEIVLGIDPAGSYPPLGHRSCRVK